ncbi:MAG TPA: hypothetical protein VN730_15050 [Steroidobacteraceae bacterium]|nr:hypothetical protein [Steroidobacteraceae bacterium]
MQRSGNSHDGADAAPHASALAHGVELADLGVLRVRGADAERFLQGQLSNDLTRLARESSILAGLHNPQGRTVALLRLAATGEHDFLAVLPRALVASVAQRLSRFILRSKVQVTDESSGWRIRGNVGEQAAMREPSSVREQPSGGLALAVPGEPARWIGIVPAAARASESQTASEAQAASESHAAALAARNGWRLLDIAAGLPQIYPQTSELFVAQMLNLDAIDAISFSKGCYTGQEVIARAHYRGRVKRRMQRWRTTAPAALSPGDSARIADGRTVRVVDAAQRPDGSCEFLAVAPLAASASTAAGAAAADEEPAAEPTDKILLEAEQLPLPYGLAS